MHVNAIPAQPPLTPASKRKQKYSLLPTPRRLPLLLTVAWSVCEIATFQQNSVGGWEMEQGRTHETVVQISTKGHFQEFRICFASIKYCSYRL